MIEIEKISVVEAKLYHYYITDCQDPENTDHFQYIVDKFASDLDVDNNRIRIRWHIKIVAAQKQKIAKHEVFLDAMAEVQFVIPDLDKELTFDENKTPIVNQSFLVLLAGIAYSTIRGLVAGATKGTLFHTAYLPIYPPQKLLVQ